MDLNGKPADDEAEGRQRFNSWDSRSLLMNPRDQQPRAPPGMPSSFPGNNQAWWARGNDGTNGRGSGSGGGGGGGGGGGKPASGDMSGSLSTNLNDFYRGYDELPHVPRSGDFPSAGIEAVEKNFAQMNFRNQPTLGNEKLSGNVSPQPHSDSVLEMRSRLLQMEGQFSGTWPHANEGQSGARSSASGLPPPTGQKDPMSQSPQDLMEQTWMQQQMLVKHQLQLQEQLQMYNASSISRDPAVVQSLSDKLNHLTSLCSELQEQMRVFSPQVDATATNQISNNAQSQQDVVFPRPAAPVLPSTQVQQDTSWPIPPSSNQINKSSASEQPKQSLSDSISQRGSGKLKGSIPPTDSEVQEKPAAPRGYAAVVASRPKPQAKVQPARTKPAATAKAAARNSSGVRGNSEIDVQRIFSGKERRTTLMIRNVPNKYTRQNLQNELDAKARGTYDFLYLPIDFRNKCNLGYAFINMMSPNEVVRLHKALSGAKWTQSRSEKKCSISWGRLQGKAALVKHFKQSSFLKRIPPDFRPVVFYSSGPKKGQVEAYIGAPK